METDNRINSENFPPLLRKKGLEKRLLKLLQESDVVFMGIFGSYAKGENRRGSDVDVLIEYDKNSHRSLLDLIRLENSLSNLFRRKIDLLTPKAINPYLRDEIIGSIKVIYERR
jgi:predicted nucleotidyltransferase